MIANHSCTQAHKAQGKDRRGPLFIRPVPRHNLQALRAALAALKEK